MKVPIDDLPETMALKSIHGSWLKISWLRIVPFTKAKAFLYEGIWPRDWINVESILKGCLKFCRCIVGRLGTVEQV